MSGTSYNGLKYRSIIRTSILFASIIAILLFVSFSITDGQPKLGHKSVRLIHEGSFQFRDLNKNGKLDPYEDWRLPVDERISNLIGQMTLEEKVGLMFHANFAVPSNGSVRYKISRRERKSLEGTGYGNLTGQTLSTATAKEYIEEKHFRCILNNGTAEPKLFAEWSNNMQEIAEKSRLGIPILFSSDPRHGIGSGSHVQGSQYFSEWPGLEGQYGITASKDTALIKKYGEVIAEEFRAVGLHMLLGPQIDVTTEPRWRRNFGSFSESAELTSEMLGYFMDGAQGDSVGSDKILTMLKHWPGSGPHKGGTGDWLVYPGNNLDYHLIPWRTGFEKGALGVMGYYSGTYHDTLGVNYSKYFSTEIIRNQLGYKGVICTDWQVIGRKGPLYPTLVGNPVIDRFEMSIDAGVDQFGGEILSEDVIELVKEGKIPESRIDLSVARILQWHFKLGLFENPYVDPHEAEEIVGSEKNRQLGYQAQLESIVMLDNDGLLPLTNGGAKPRLYLFGIDPTVAANYGQIVDDPAEADMAILKVNSRGNDIPGGTVSNDDTEVNIDLPSQTMEFIKQVASTNKPIVVVINLERALVVLPKELLNIANSTFMVFDIQDAPLLDVIFGKFNPIGKLPFDLPSSMEAVREQLEDVPFDTKDPLFKFGYGLSYE
jgi:beta-glucosidase